MNQIRKYILLLLISCANAGVQPSVLIKEILTHNNSDVSFQNISELKEYLTEHIPQEYTVPNDYESMLMVLGAITSTKEDPTNNPFFKAIIKKDKYEIRRLASAFVIKHIKHVSSLSINQQQQYDALALELSHHMTHETDDLMHAIAQFLISTEHASDKHMQRAQNALCALLQFEELKQHTFTYYWHQYKTQVTQIVTISMLGIGIFCAIYFGILPAMNQHTAQDFFNEKQLYIQGVSEKMVQLIGNNEITNFQATIVMAVNAMIKQYNLTQFSFEATNTTETHIILNTTNTTLLQTIASRLSARRISSTSSTTSPHFITYNNANNAQVCSAQDTARLSVGHSFAQMILDATPESATTLKEILAKAMKNALPGTTLDPTKIATTLVVRPI